MSRGQLAARQERTKGAVGRGPWTVNRVYGDRIKYPVHVTCVCPRDTYKKKTPLPPPASRLSPPWWVVHGQSARVNMRSARPRKRKTPGGEAGKLWKAYGLRIQFKGR